MKTINIQLKNETETLSFGKNLASLLQPSDVIILTGDLGSGKTKLTQGILSYFKLDDEISSPTFTIVNEYNKNDISIFHFDVYRLEDSSEFLEIGGDEYFKKGICIIEWGEIIRDVLPKEYIQIVFSKDDLDENVRNLNISSFGDKYDSYLERI